MNIIGLEIKFKENLKIKMKKLCILICSIILFLSLVIGLYYVIKSLNLLNEFIFNRFSDHEIILLVSAIAALIAIIINIIINWINNKIQRKNFIQNNIYYLQKNLEKAINEHQENINSIDLKFFNFNMHYLGKDKIQLFVGEILYEKKKFGKPESDFWLHKESFLHQYFKSIKIIILLMNEIQKHNDNILNNITKLLIRRTMNQELVILQEYKDYKLAVKKYRRYCNIIINFIKNNN